ncbi:hypothetical protein [Actinokineospora inagensis]|uniref:hypothetical protein n=1 Tax=Actinokineospora inagensis TaxID=103730 RepID=UPI0004276BBF|nr:hypothetical protein [Actinokineospora inagensis]
MGTPTGDGSRNAALQQGDQFTGERGESLAGWGEGLLVLRGGGEHEGAFYRGAVARPASGAIWPVMARALKQQSG